MIVLMWGYIEPVFATERNSKLNTNNSTLRAQAYEQTPAF